MYLLCVTRRNVREDAEENRVVLIVIFFGKVAGWGDEGEFGGTAAGSELVQLVKTAGAQSH